MDYEIANLNNEQKLKLKEMEKELGVVLIAWENKENDGDYYQMYEDDRI